MLRINPNSLSVQFGNRVTQPTELSIIDFFEKEVTPHGTGAKIPCSSKYIGKKAYVVIKRD